MASLAEAIQVSKVGRLGKAYTFGSWITLVFPIPLLATSTSKATTSTSAFSLLLTVV